MVLRDGRFDRVTETSTKRRRKLVSSKWGLAARVKPVNQAGAEEGRKVDRQKGSVAVPLHVPVALRGEGLERCGRGQGLLGRYHGRGAFARHQDLWGLGEGRLEFSEEGFTCNELSESKRTWAAKGLLEKGRCIGFRQV